jgi:hypothetical protein
MADMDEPIDERLYRTGDFAKEQPMSDPREDLLKSALTNLKTALAMFVDAQMPGGKVPSLATLENAAHLVDEAQVQLRMLMEPPNPYADQALRPGLGYAGNVGAVPGDGARLTSINHPNWPKEHSDG